MSNSSDDSSEEDERPEPDTTLFIKNLNFNTNEEDIKEVSIEFMMLLLEVLKWRFVDKHEWIDEDDVVTGHSALWGSVLEFGDLILGLFNSSSSADFL